MLSRHDWSVWMIMALALSGCKAGGLTPSWSNPFAFLMPKKEAEPEKPSAVASPTPIKPGYSSTEDRSGTQAKTGIGSNTQAASSLSSSRTGYSSLEGDAAYGSTGSPSGSRYGGNMPYGAPGRGGSLSAESPPYGVPSSNSLGTSSMGNRTGISPQVGRYDPGAGYRDNPPLTASRASVAGYTSRDYESSASSADRYGSSYSSASSATPSWRSWESASSGRNSSFPSDPLARPDRYDRSSSWNDSTQRYGGADYSRTSSSGAWADRAAMPSSSAASNRNDRYNESYSSSSPTGSRPDYSQSGYRSSAAGATGGTSSGTYSNPYYTSPSRETNQDRTYSSSGRDSFTTSPEGRTGTSAADPRSAASGTSGWGRPSSGTGSSLGETDYRPGETGYQPGNTGYQPGNTGYQPGNTGYQPGNTGYRPGDTGYSPPNTNRYSSPTEDRNRSSDSSSSGEYRPGTTRTYQPGQSF